MLLTLKCMSVALLAGYLIGVPLIWLLRRGAQLSKTDWLYAPFVGLAAATLVAQQLVYLDVRLTWSVPFMWGAVVALWVGLGMRFGLAAPFRNCPWPVLLATLGVYLVHGLGLLVVGPDLYVGRFHSDRFNYICIAQYMIDLPFSANWDGIEHRAYLADAAKLVRAERIGVEVLQGFLSVTAREMADRLFEPLILLGPALTVPALVLVCRALNFGWRSATVAGLLGGLLPALATLHTLCFLANVVSIPFVFASIAATSKLVTDPSARRVGVAAVLYAGTASLYTEFTPALFAIAAGSWVFGILLRTGAGAWRSGRMVVAAGLLAVVVFPKSPESGHFATIHRSASVTPKDHPVSWLQGEQAFGAVWVYDSWSIDGPDSRRRIVIGLGLLFTAVGAAGLFRLTEFALTRRRAGPGTTDPADGGARVTALLVVCLAAGPLLLFVDSKHDYQAMKLILSFAPLWGVALVAALRPRAATDEGSPWKRIRLARYLGVRLWVDRNGLAGQTWRYLGLVPVVVPVLVCGYGTAALVYNLTRADKRIERSHHLSARNTDFNDMRHALRSIPKTDVVLGVGPGFVANGEVSFAAHRHRVWLACVEINDRQALGCAAPLGTLRSLREGRQLVDLTTVPQEALVVTINAPDAPLRVEGDKRLERTFGPFQFWRVGPGPYQLITTEYAMRPPELDHPSPPKKK